MTTSEKTHGEDHPATLHAMNTLASAYANGGKSKKAEGLLKKVIRRRKRAFVTGHADALVGIARLLSAFWS